MARLSLRLPDSLHELLAERAKEEGVSLNHYLVYTLTRASALQSASEQRRVFEGLLHRVSGEDAEADLRALLELRTEPVT